MVDEHDAFERLVRAVEDLGWSISLQTDTSDPTNDDPDVVGMIIGEDSYLEAIFEVIEKGLEDDD